MYIAIPMILPIMLFIMLIAVFMAITNKSSVIQIFENRIFIIVTILISSTFIYMYNNQNLNLKTMENKINQRDTLIEQSDKTFEIITIGLDNFIDISNEDIQVNKELLINLKRYTSKERLVIKPYLIENKKLAYLKDMMLYYENQNKIPIINTDGTKLGLIYNPDDKLINQIDESMSISQKDIVEEIKSLTIIKLITITFSTLTVIAICTSIITSFFNKYESEEHK